MLTELGISAVKIIVFYVFFCNSWRFIWLTAWVWVSHLRHVFIVDSFRAANGLGEPSGDNLAYLLQPWYPYDKILTMAAMVMAAVEFSIKICHVETVGTTPFPSHRGI